MRPDFESHWYKTLNDMEINELGLYYVLQNNADGNCGPHIVLQILQILQISPYKNHLPVWKYYLCMKMGLHPVPVVIVEKYDEDVVVWYGEDMVVWYGEDVVVWYDEDVVVWYDEDVEMAMDYHSMMYLQRLCYR